jgi:hypothetical protein
MTLFGRTTLKLYRLGPRRGVRVPVPLTSGALALALEIACATVRLQQPRQRTINNDDIVRVACCIDALDPDVSSELCSDRVRDRLRPGGLELQSFHPPRPPHRNLAGAGVQSSPCGNNGIRAARGRGDASSHTQTFDMVCELQAKFRHYTLSAQATRTNGTLRLPRGSLLPHESSNV